MRELGFVRRAVLAGTIALSLTGAMAALDGARAMPSAPLPSTATAADVTTVQYDGYGYRRPYRHRRRAGLYNCGPGAAKTHLSRRACGGTFPPRF